MKKKDLTFHLKELSGARLITQERMGRNLIYRADYDRMSAVLGYLTENCCQGADCALSQAAVSCHDKDLYRNAKVSRASWASSPSPPSPSSCDDG